MSIGAEVDTLIEAVILKRMAEPDAVEVLQQALSPEDDGLTEQLQELAGERDALLARREQIEEAVIAADVDITTFARLSKKIESQITAIDERMCELTTSREADPLAAEFSGSPDFGEWWSSASVEDKRRLTRLLMEIHILYAKPGTKKFDTQRVKITWKQ